MTEETKICSKCKIKRPLTDFGKCDKNRDGLKSSCKPCYNEYRRERYKNNPEFKKKVIQASVSRRMERYNGDPEFKKSCIKKNSEYSKRRYNQDPEFKKKADTRSKDYWKKRYHSDPDFRERVNSASTKSSICKIIRDHHVDLKDDPEHLPTEFLQTIIGVKCDTPSRYGEGIVVPQAPVGSGLGRLPNNGGKKNDATN